ncbi:MAG: hypothetical protein HQ518_31940 [Rhodopirellula sp.]|nr:hypothetical protein [Rhodopirellula sp.]
MACTVFAIVSASAWAADEFDRPPINYRDSSPDNCISRLQAGIDSGRQTLTFDMEHGYLKAVLASLSVPVESQMLVFSKTSLQRHRISPRTPRALYFNDDVYIGYCQSGDVLEVSVVDPQLGTVFYTLDQESSDEPRFERRIDNCLICHSSSRTGGVPGHVVRSLFVDASGQPLFSAGSRTVDHTTPMKDRWGGWYVTGTHGSQSHVGNLITRTKRVYEPVDNSQGHNVEDLSKRFRVSHYLTSHSDIVALMVMEHQTLVHNRLTNASYETRKALHYEQTMNEALGNEPGHRLESTTRRVHSAGDDLVEALLLVDEAPLSAAIRGTSGYTELFAKSGKRDAQGRSLRDFDLNTRLFRYPCSYLIYSEAFDALPAEMREHVWHRLWEVLTATEPEKKFSHLSASDRAAIVEIIRETKTGLPDYWTSGSGD